MGIRKRRTALLLLLALASTLFYLFFTDDASPQQKAAAHSYSDEFAKGALGDLNPALFFKQEQHLRHRPAAQQVEEEDDTGVAVSLRISTDNEYDEENEEVYDRDTDEDITDYDEDDENDEADKTGKGGTHKMAAGEKGRTMHKLAEKESENAAAKGWSKKGNGVHTLSAQEDDVHQTRLIILAYMRTGSSMTGRILQFSPDVFYWYEPLHSLERYYVTGGHPESSYRNKTMNEMFKYSAMAGGNVSAALTCDIGQVYRGSLLDYFMTYATYSTRPFYPCFKQANTTQQWTTCARNMTSVCKKKFKVTAVKTIRLHMERAEEILRNDPKVKVVHLVRDPRGVLVSRKRLGFANFKQLDQEAALLCGKLKEDLNKAPKPGDPLRARYLLVRYEDIATVPMEHTQQLYSFMGLRPSQEVLQSVKGMMLSAKKKKACPTCTAVPLNSTEVAQAWRDALTWQQTETISKACADVMQLLGYRVKFDSEAQLKDLRVSAVGPVKIQ